MSERNLAVARRLAELWNAGDLDGVLALFHSDAVQRPSPEWPEFATLVGRDQIAAGMSDWREAWATIDIEVPDVEAYADRIVGAGVWRQRGRVSGVEGSSPFGIVLTFRDGKVAAMEWFSDRDTAVAAARDADPA